MRLLSILGALALTLSLTATSGLAGSPPDPGAIGLYAVGHTSFVVVDASRNAGTTFGGRPIFVSVWYPVDPQDVNAASAQAVYPLDPVSNRWPESTSAEWERFGFDRAYERLPVSRGKPFPLVVFSPGFSLPYYANLFVGTRLASHGFVVAIVMHYADNFFPWEPSNPRAVVAAVHRPRDVSFALSAVLGRSAAAGLLSDAVRSDQIAAAGHSLGGYAAMVLAGGDDLVCDFARNPPPETCVESPPDPRIKAIVSFDGSSQLLHFRELARITVPAMGIGQEWETVGNWHAREHAAISGHPNYRVDVNNSLHISFTTMCETARLLGDKALWTTAQVESWTATPVCTTAIPPLEAHRLATKYMIAFLKTNLAGEKGYQDILTPGWAITRERDIEFFVTERTNANATDEVERCPTADPCPTFGFFPNQPGSTREQAEKDPAEAPSVEVLP